MQKRTLGRTGLEVTAMGMGCGGHSKLGLIKGKDHDNAVAVIRKAIDLGINIIDTAEYYKTESAVGEAIKGQRDGLVIATKFGPRRDGHIRSPEQIEAALDQSLRNLQTDVIDIYQVHGVGVDIYNDVVDQIVPVLEHLRDKGKIRFTGITEAFGSDTTHKMLNRAVDDDCWDTIMVGFNFMNPSARERILRVTQEKGIGVLCMFAIRRALTDPVLAKEMIDALIESGQVDGTKLNPDAPLDFLVNGHCGSIAEAGYRFCLHEPGIDCVLSGTGSVDHLEDNSRSMQKPQLPDDILQRLEEHFGHVDTVACN
jgi:aryl-alcohol dehydrogenase-like predicted oxidoreductase